jgi:YceI-like domain
MYFNKSPFIVFVSVMTLTFVQILICQAQEIYTAKNASVAFFAGTVMEDIDGKSKQIISFLNTKTGEVAVSIDNKSFKFKSNLMEEHFNENYMETEKYPKTEFKGKIDNVATINFTNPNFFDVTISGTLTTHGVSQPKTIQARLKNNNGVLEGTAKFSVVLEDHKIDRPKIVWQKLAEKIDITANLFYEPLKK